MQKELMINDIIEMRNRLIEMAFECLPNSEEEGWLILMVKNLNIVIEVINDDYN